MHAARRFSSQLGKVLPAPVSNAVRRVAGAYGTLTARWRMVPDFLIVGAQRSGTTTLFRMLSEHPQVIRPTLNKGMAYFDLNYQRGWSWYLSHFPLRRITLGRRRARRFITFESSGYYMFHPLAPERISTDLPRAKIVVMLRDPVDRAHSAHRHEQRRGFETEDFERALELEPSRTEGEVEKIVADPTYASFSLQHHAYLGRGHYAEQIHRLMEAVGRDRIYVIDADLFFEDPASEFRDLCRWLGLDDPQDVDTRAWNAAPRAPLEDKLRERLATHFEPYDRRLEQMMGRRPSWRSADVPIDEQIDDSP